MTWNGEVCFGRFDEEVSIGREPDNHIVLLHEDVSPHHARIIPADGRLLLQDVAGGRMLQPTVLSPLGTFHVSGYRISARVVSVT